MSQREEGITIPFDTMSRRCVCVASIRKASVGKDLAKHYLSLQNSCHVIQKLKNPDASFPSVQ